MAFDEAKVVRGQPGNPGQFAAKPPGVVSPEQAERLAKQAAVNEEGCGDCGDDGCRGECNRCTDCDNSLDDGEGWDGLCGSCADRAERPDMLRDCAFDQVDVADHIISADQDFDTLGSLGLLDQSLLDRARVAVKAFNDSLYRHESSREPDGYQPDPHPVTAQEFSDGHATELAELETEFTETGGRGPDLAERIDRLRALRDRTTNDGVSAASLIPKVDRALNMITGSEEINELRAANQLADTKHTDAIYYLQALRAHLASAEPADSYDALPPQAQDAWMTGMNGTCPGSGDETDPTPDGGRLCIHCGGTVAVNNDGIAEDHPEPDRL